jgi:hypothetical protein
MDGDVSDSTLSTWKAGAAKAVITPTEPMWLAGWAVRKEPSRGTLSDLFCRALTIEVSAGTKLVIVSVDLIALPKWLVDPVAKKIEAQFGIARSQIIFCASHTHCGPEIRPDKEYFFQIPREWMEKVPAYNARLQETMQRVVAESIERLVPAQLFFSQTKATFGQNRRKGNTVHDEDVPVLEVTEAHGKTIAIVFGYACHNLTLDPQDRRFSADWSGFAAEQLEREHPGCVALFLTGAGADQDPVPRGAIEMVEQHGSAIASAMNEACDRSTKLEGNIATTWVEVPLEFAPVTREQLQADVSSDDLPRKRKAQWLLDQLDVHHATLPKHHLYPIQGVRIGQLTLIAMSCEPVVDWALQIKRTVPLVWVAGYCNDMFCYVPTRRMQAEGGYEGGRATLWSWVPGPFTDDVEDRVSAGIRQVFSNLRLDPAATRGEPQETPRGRGG